MKFGVLKSQSQVTSFINQSFIKRVAISDYQLSGLQLDLIAPKKAVWRLRYLSPKRRIRRCITIGSSKVLSLTEARNIAIQYKRRLAMGEDLHDSKEALKAIPKLSDFIEQQYLPYVKTYKRSWIYDVGLIKNHINPNFGSMYMDELKKQDVVIFISKHLQTHAPGSVNRVVILLRYIYNLAIKWEMAGITKNPTAGIPLLEENNQKERYLTAEEARKLVGALKSSCNEMLQYIIPMLILTGARKNEVQQAKWEDINWEQRIWRIPLSKSGKARHVPISDGALILLETIPRIEGCQWIFPNPKTHKPYKSFYGSWHTARKSVGLEDVRVHDLRHSFASFLVNSGRSLYEVQRILGHTQISTTQRYAHLSQDSLLTAANEVGKAIPSLLINPIEEVPMLKCA
jgi:integrase